MFTLFRSHKGYTPLSPSEYPAHAHPLWTRGRVMILLLVAILASGIMNIVLSVKLWRWPTTAMDNYQDLNTQPIINEDALRELPPINPSDNAVVTTLYTDAYATAIVTLGHSLRKANSTASRLLLYLPSQVSDYALCIATASGFTPEPIARIPPPDNGKGVYARFLDQYSKLNLWTLDKAPHSYKGVVYLDADTLVLRNFDELFHLPANFAAVPDVYRTDGFVLGFNAGVLFLRPSSDAFAHMLARIADARYPRTEAEQAFLNHFYGAEALRLPYAYNANLAIKERQPRLWAALLAREARVVHYTVVKPFLVAEDDGHTVVDVHDMDEHVLRRMGTKGGLFQEETRLWLDMWRETRREYAEAFRACRARHVGEALEHGPISSLCSVRGDSDMETHLAGGALFRPAEADGLQAGMDILYYQVVTYSITIYCVLDEQMWKTWASDPRFCHFSPGEPGSICDNPWRHTCKFDRGGVLKG